MCVSRLADALYRIFAETSAAHDVLISKRQRASRRFFRRRGTFSAALMREPRALRHLTGFWDKFRTVMQSTFTNASTPGSMLASVLVVLVEARQAVFDVYNFGRGHCRVGYRTVANDSLVDEVLRVIDRLQKERDSLLYFVGQRRATRAATATGTLRRAMGNAVLTGNQPPADDVKLGSALVTAPLLLLRDRLGGTDIAPLFPDIHKIEAAVASFSVQGYEDWITLLFEADTVGSAIGALAARDSCGVLYASLTQVFISARANALASLSNAHDLDLVH